MTSDASGKHASAITPGSTSIPPRRTQILRGQRQRKLTLELAVLIEQAGAEQVADSRRTTVHAKFGRSRKQSIPVDQAPPARVVDAAHTAGGRDGDPGLRGGIETLQSAQRTGRPPRRPRVGAPAQDGGDEALRARHRRPRLSVDTALDDPERSRRDPPRADGVWTRSALSVPTRYGREVSADVSGRAHVWSVPTHYRWEVSGDVSGRTHVWSVPT